MVARRQPHDAPQPSDAPCIVTSGLMDRRDPCKWITAVLTGLSLGNYNLDFNFGRFRVPAKVGPGTAANGPGLRLVKYCTSQRKLAPGDRPHGTKTIIPAKHPDSAAIYYVCLMIYMRTHMCPICRCNYI